MQATKRKLESSVIGLLLEEPYRFEFTQAINILLRDLRRQGVSYEHAFREVISFRNSLSLSFPASEVQAFEVEPNTLDGLPKRVRITPAFIGLLGASGTLPLHDTERIAARKTHDGDESQRELLDVFSNRLIGLFYEAWGKYRVEHRLDVGDQDTLLQMLSAIAGTRANSRAASIVQQETKAYFAGLLRTRPISASTVEQVLAAYFGLPIRLEQFVGCWDPIPENRRSTLGKTMPVLGLSAALGTRSWRHDLTARLQIGPLDEAQAEGFLPGGKSLVALEEMVRMFAVPALRYEVRLLLAPPCIKPLTLSTRATPRRLGWSTFLTSTPGLASRPEVRSSLRLAGKGQPPRSG